MLLTSSHTEKDVPHGKRQLAVYSASEGVLFRARAGYVTIWQLPRASLCCASSGSNLYSLCASVDFSSLALHGVYLHAFDCPLPCSWATYCLLFTPGLLATLQADTFAQFDELDMEIQGIRDQLQVGCLQGCTRATFP